MVRERLEKFHRGERGALAMLCLAGIIIICMMGLLIFDVTEVANEKVHVQASADASAHAQATVMARTMNMIAFSNVGKRINIGYVTAYDAILGWMGWLVAAGWILTLLCLAAAVFFPPIAKLCGWMVKIMAATSCVYAKEEGVDRQLRFLQQQVAVDTFGAEVRAFNNYQQYMADLTPYWAWSAGVWRGFVNRAPVTVGYPAPKDNVQYTSTFPAAPQAGHVWDAMCHKVDNPTPLENFAGAFSEAFRSLAPGNEGDSPGGFEGFLNEITQQSDRMYMYFDFLVKNAISAATNNVGTDVEGDMSGVESEGQGASLEDIDCDTIDQLGQSVPEVDVEPPVECARNNAGEKIDPNCTDRGRILTVNGQTPIELAEDCAHEMLEDLLGEVLDAAVELVDAVNCANINPIGAYGGAFLAGTLALLLDPSRFAAEMPWPARDLIGALLPAKFEGRCGEQARDRLESVAEGGAKWQVVNEDWLMHGSTLIFAYRPNAARNMESRSKYDFAGGEPNAEYLSTGSSGVWALSRGEMAWQGNDDPNLWESLWASRIRPVALDGEWASYQNFTPWDALDEMQIEMFSAILLAHGSDIFSGADAQTLLTHPYTVGGVTSWGGMMNLVDEYFTTGRSFQPMTDDRMGGIVK